MNNPTIFDIFHKHNIQYCHFKSSEHICDGLDGRTDLDILVDESDYELCTSLLQQEKFSLALSPQWKQFDGIEDWLGLHNGNIIHIHLHTKLLTGRQGSKEIHLPWEQYILKTRQFNESYNMFTIDPSLEYILLGVRVGLKTKVSQVASGTLPDNIMRELYFLNEHVNTEMARSYAQELLGGIAIDFISAIDSVAQEPSSENLQAIRSFSKMYTKQYQRIGNLASLCAYIKATCIIRLSRLARRVGVYIQTKKQLSQGGVVIAILGADGSGKTTLVSSLKKSLGWKLETRTIYLGRHPILRFAEKIKPAKRKAKTSPQPPSTPSESSWYKILLYILNARYRYATIKKMKRLRSHGYVVLSDRFPQNQFTGMNDGPSIQPGSNSIKHIMHRYEQKLYEKMSHTEPDIVIKLITDPEVAFHRKPEHHIESIIRKNMIVQNLSFTHSLVSEIDTSNSDIASVYIQAQQHIWNSLATINS